MKPLYVKIDVKTIDDLPKKDMVIYGKHKNSVTLEAIEFHMNDLQWGLANIDWYFSSVSEEKVRNELCIYPRIKR